MMEIVQMWFSYVHGHVIKHMILSCPLKLGKKITDTCLNT